MATSPRPGYWAVYGLKTWFFTNDLDLNVGQISLTFRNGKLNLRFKSIVTASSATEGPVPEHEDAGRGITVPESPIVLNDDQLQQLQDAIAEVGDGSDNGIIQYLISFLMCLYHSHIRLFV